MKTKKTMVATVGASLLSASLVVASPAYADTEFESFAFDRNTIDSHLIVLSESEMRSTEGELWPQLAFGFLGGYTGGVSYLANTSNPTLGGALGAISWGIFSGATGVGRANSIGGGLLGLVGAGGSYWTSSWW